MISAILFDLDGTLADTLPLYIRSYRQALAPYGIILSDKQIVDICFGKTEKIICATLGIPEKVQEFSDVYFAAVKHHAQEGKVFDGVNEFLRLKKENPLQFGVISFAYSWYVKDILQTMQLHNYFDVIIGYDDVKQPKPHPEAILLACETLGIHPYEAVMVGDSKSDIGMGKAAGSKTVLFHPPGYELFYDLEKLKESQPDKIIRHFGELQDLILSDSRHW